MTNKTSPAIGFIGLGLMGSAVVSRLQDLDYKLTVLGRKNRSPIDAAVTRGAVEVSSAKELASRSDIVILCVDTSDAVESLVYGDNGIMAGVKPGAIVIDFGTSKPESTKQIGAKMAAIGAHYMDAPLGRTPAHAKDGLLNIMAAGDAAVFEQVKGTLQDMGENVLHVGPLGAGHTLKLINNFFGMTLATSMSEAFVVADHAGISRENLYNVMSSGPLHCAMMDFVKANAIDGDSSKLAFSIANANKDLGYYTSMVESFDAKSCIAPATQQTLSNAVEQGYGDKDVPVMLDYIQANFTKSGK